MDLSAQDSDKELSDDESDSQAVHESSVPSASAIEKFPNKNRTPLNWTSNLTFKKLEQFSSSAGVIHSLSVGSPEIDYFSLFVNSDL